MLTSHHKNAIISIGDLYMEDLILFAMIIILMLCLGFGVGDIIIMVLVVVAGLSVLTGAFFVLSLALLLTSKRKRGVFTRINEEGHFPSAVYEIDGEEYSNIFPCEMVMRDKLYVPEKTVVLYFSKLRHAVIDKNALITIIAGSAIFIPLAVIAVMFLINTFSG